jgi:hypothetical protein
MRKPLMPGDRVRCRAMPPGRCPGHRVTSSHFYRVNIGQTVTLFPDPCGYTGGATVSAGQFVRLSRRAARTEDDRD